MTSRRGFTRRVVTQGLGASTLALPMSALAQNSGKSLTIYVGYAAGGANDLYARLLGKYMAQEMGLAGAVVQNIPGAGSIEAANRLFASAPKDGLTIGALGRNVITEPLLENANARYVSAKFNWIGSPSRENATLFTLGDSPYRKLADVQQKEIKVGATAPGAEGYSFARVLNETLGTKLKPILGYTGSADILQALERGEVEGSVGLSWNAAVKSSHPHWVRDGLVHPLLQLGQVDTPDLAGVPRAGDLIKTPADRELYSIFSSRLDFAFPFAAPPGVPDADVARLRKSFDASMKNPQFVEEAKKMSLEINPLSGDDMAKIVERLYASDPATIRRAIAVMKP